MAERQDASCDNTDITIGRPRIAVKKEDILSLRRLNYSWSRIAELLEISRHTLYRRLTEFGINTKKYSTISELELDALVKQVRTEHPNTGEAMLQGLLVHRNIQVPREKLRAAIHRIDHEGTVGRRSSIISRRVYTTPHPNYMWHVDGNHKMIRWRLVVHAGVDGFSRCVVYIKCANNNCATTVLNAFHEGVAQFGQPFHVRSDHGGENIEIWRSMLSTWNIPSRIITGSSTHNERIERMWRDVTRCVSSSFITLFSTLEIEGVLDPINEVDIFCLHFIFIPRINKSLADFQGSWNCHPLSTEGNLSPLQLYTEGLVAIQQDTLPHSSTDQSGITSGSTISDQLSNGVEIVEVPSNKFLPCSQLLIALQSSIDPLSQCADLGKQFYYTCIQIVGQHLQGTGCNICTLE